MYDLLYFVGYFVVTVIFSFIVVMTVLAVLLAILSALQAVFQYSLPSFRYYQAAAKARNLAWRQRNRMRRIYWMINGPIEKRPTTPFEIHNKRFWTLMEQQGQLMRRAQQWERFGL